MNGVADSFQHALSEAELRHRLDCQRLESAWSNKLSELESLMHAQRERSLALVEEKDRELQALRASGGRRVSDEYSWQLPRNLDGNLEVGMPASKRGLLLWQNQFCQSKRSLELCL